VPCGQAAAGWPVGRDPLCLDRALKDPAEQREPLASALTRGAGGEAVSLPAAGDLRCEVAQRVPAEGGADVRVAQAGVADACLRRERRGVDRRPRVLDVLVQRFRAAVDPGKHPSLLGVLDLEVEAVSVAFQAERLSA
jgi:hypothetical protein